MNEEDLKKAHEVLISSEPRVFTDETMALYQTVIKLMKHMEEVKRLREALVDVCKVGDALYSYRYSECGLDWDDMLEKHKDTIEQALKEMKTK
jgi:hypothetical protein